MHQTAFPMQGVCTADGPWLYQARLSSFWHASNSIISRAKVYYRPGHDSRMGQRLLPKRTSALWMITIDYEPWS
jgi:hypothetical protein